ncbi:MAG: hypothetical protein KKF48_01365 [Nanoarchaeota archaeon]|nr:hypothetical protein [Nanoarchaeota archaeon]MBU1027671.1 hypothetical protein [Nanoarchaeota archaeon]
MLKEFLRESISIIVGKQSDELTDLLNNKKHVNEFILAKKLDITINQTRNLLYKIADYGLVSSIRKKDKKKGWYTYFWKIENIKVLEFLRDILMKRIDQLNNQIKSRETKIFYICERCNIEFNEENALAYDFTCNECGSVFVVKDNSKILKELRRNLSKFKNQLKLVELEVEVEQSQIEKKRVKEVRKKEKEKKSKSAAKRKKTKFEKKLSAKEKLPKGEEIVKKIVKKNPKKNVKHKKIKKPTKKKIIKKSKSKKDFPKFGLTRLKAKSKKRG